MYSYMLNKIISVAQTTEKLEKLIDELIAKSFVLKPDKVGTVKSCFFFGDYALLREPYYKKNDLNAVIKIHAELKEKGVHLAPIIYFKVVEHNPRGKYFYVLQEKALGEPLFEFEGSSEKMLSRYNTLLSNLAAEPLAFYEKFVSDYFEIRKAGLCLDIWTPGNFIYNKGKSITFIDINHLNPKLRAETEPDFSGCMVALSGGTAYQVYEKEEDINIKLAEIFRKLNTVFENNGCSVVAITELIAKEYSRVYEKM